MTTNHPTPGDELVERIARIIDPRLWELRDEDRQRDHADWERNVKPGWGDISFEQWATRGLESSLAKAAAIIEALRTRDDAARSSTTEVERLRKALLQTQMMLEQIAHLKSTDFAEVNRRIIANREALQSKDHSHG